MPNDKGPSGSVLRTGTERQKMKEIQKSLQNILKLWHRPLLEGKKKTHTLCFSCIWEFFTGSFENFVLKLIYFVSIMSGALFFSFIQNKKRSLSIFFIVHSMFPRIYWFKCSQNRDSIPGLESQSADPHTTNWVLWCWAQSWKLFFISSNSSHRWTHWVCVSDQLHFFTFEFIIIMYMWGFFCIICVYIVWVCSVKEKQGESHIMN